MTSGVGDVRRMEAVGDVRRCEHSFRPAFPFQDPSLISTLYTHDPQAHKYRLTWRIGHEYEGKLFDRKSGTSMWRLGPERSRAVPNVVDNSPYPYEPCIYVNTMMCRQRTPSRDIESPSCHMGACSQLATVARESRASEQHGNPSK